MSRLWHVILCIDSKHESHDKLCREVDRLMPGPASIEPPSRPLGRYYCSVWRNLDETEFKAFFFRLLDGDLKACRKYILEMTEEDVIKSVEGWMEKIGRGKREAESMWIDLLVRREKEVDFGN